MPRKAKPTALKKLEGNPGMKPLPEEEPEIASAQYCEAPEEVKAQPYAEGVWKKTLPYLVAMGTIGESDFGEFSRYCIAGGIHKEATLLMSQTGLTYETETETGAIMSRKSPFIEIINTQARIAQSLASEFGLTPSARAKMGIVLGKNKKDKLSEFLN
jgi:P27 family predicted phage terminase small subunit